MIDLSSSLGVALANHLWQSTLFVGAAWLLSLLLRRYSASLRYAIWLTASVKFLVPFSLLIALGGLLPRPHKVVDSQRAAYSTMDAVGQPFYEPVLSTPRALYVGRNAQASSRSFPLLLAVVWFCGAMIVLTVWWMRCRQVSAAIRLSTPDDVGREAKVLRGLDVQRRVELRLSEDPMEPGIFGMFRPKLIWPAMLSERLDDEHIEAIMAHELTHVRRLDNLTAALHMFVEAVFWFHPAVWWMERHMVEERERACDEAVLERGGRPAVYAASLLKACRFCVESPVMCVAGISGADLTRRVGSIMTLHARRLGALGRTTLAALAIATITMPLAFGLLRMIPVDGQIYHATEPLPSFEVATVKPSQGGPKSYNLTPDVFPYFNIRTATLIMNAYRVPPFGQEHYLLNGPSWIFSDSERYDVMGKIDDELVAKMRTMPPEELHREQMLMMQSLLADRFKLKVHFETREMPIYELVVAKGGPKLTPSQAKPEVDNNIQPKNLSWDDLKTWLPNGQMRARVGPGGAHEMIAKCITIDQLMYWLPWQPSEAFTVDRSTVNRTGITGLYDISLKWTVPMHLNSPQNPAVAEDGAGGPDFFEALQKQLGLKLVPSKGPVEVIVIDHIERPSPN
jgi:uncharacterized protein (TIGR03435 family)